MHNNLDKLFLEILYEIFLSTFMSIVAIIIILFHCFKQQSLIIIFNQLLNVNNKLKDKLYNSYHLNKSNTREYPQILMFIIYIIANTILITTYLDSDTDYYYIITMIIPNLISGFFIFQYTIIVIFLKKNFYYINKLCSLIANPVEDNCVDSIFIIVSSANHQDSFVDFIIMRNAHRELCEISFSFINIMSLPILLAISAVSIDLIYSSFNFVSLITFPETFAQTLNFLDASAWIMMDISPIVVLTISITQIVAEVCINYNIQLIMYE